MWKGTALAVPNRLTGIGALAPEVRTELFQMQCPFYLIEGMEGRS